MPALKLIEAVKNGDIENTEDLLNSGEDIEQKDDYGWTALNWAAGKGYVSIIEKLLAAGADIANVGRDKRTAYQIAIAAMHLESASILQQAGVNLNKALRPYCKAYVISKLREFSDWQDSLSDLTGDEIVFIHEDLSVTRSMFHREDVIFDKISLAWEKFCEDQLAFAVPTAIDIATAHAASKPVDIHPPTL